MPAEGSGSDRERYEPHLALPGFGEDGQRRVRAARVAIVGVGGLGVPAAQYLAAAGVGGLTLVDDDVVQRSNLQRQVLFGEGDLGKPKVQVAARHLAGNNREVAVTPRGERLVAGNARALLAGHDLVVDGSDNFATRYVVNDACVLESIPLVSGSVRRYEGQATLLAPPATPCYRCLFPVAAAEPAPCHQDGVLGPLVGVVGSLLAATGLQWLATGSAPLAGRLLLADLAEGSFRRLAVERRADCALCGTNRTIHEPTAVARCSPS